MRRRVGNVVLDLGERRGVDQRALRDARFGAWADLERFHALDELRGERVVDAARGRKTGWCTRTSVPHCDTWR